MSNGAPPKELWKVVITEPGNEKSIAEQNLGQPDDEDNWAERLTGKLFQEMLDDGTLKPDQRYAFAYFVDTSEESTLERTCEVYKDSLRGDFVQVICTKGQHN